MKIINKYIVSEFLKLLILTTVAFLSIFLLVEFVERIDDLLEHNVPFTTSIKYFAYKVPYIFSLICPVAVLLAILLSLGILSRHMEITAIKAGGISLVRLAIPLLVCGAIISLFVIFINEVVVPETNKRASALEMRWLGKQPAGNIGSIGLWLRQPEGIYNIKKINIKKETLNEVSLYVIDSSFGVKELRTAREVKWNGDSWVADEAFSINFTTGRPGAPALRPNMVFNLPGPDDFSAVESNPELMSFGELKNYIDVLEDGDYDTSSYVVELYSKITFPLVSFIMVLVGMPFALRTGRRSGIADGIAISLVIAFSFWIIFAISRSLGISGVLPPILAATFPDILFLAIGIYMMSYVRE